MTLFLRLFVSLILAIIANAFFLLSNEARLIAFEPLTIAVVFVACFSMALISPALSAIGLNPPTRKDSSRERGTVKWFNVSKGYGFITRQSGEDIFVHFRSIRGNGRRALREGQTVEFTVTTGDKGPQAEEVQPLSGE